MKIFKNKTAAMFGLDARIALAIFAALSVITGVVLYSAIQNAKATALLTDFQEVGKAWEQYYLDTGLNLPRYTEDNSSPSFYVLMGNNLTTNVAGVDGWNGPYINYETSDQYLFHPQYLRFTMIVVTNEEIWGGSNGGWSDKGRCTSGKRCFVAVRLDGISSADIVEKLDSKVDGGDGAEKGHLRWVYGDDAAQHRVSLLYMPIKNPND